MITTILKNDYSDNFFYDFIAEILCFNHRNLIKNEEDSYF